MADQSINPLTPVPPVQDSLKKKKTPDKNKRPEKTRDHPKRDKDDPGHIDTYA